MPHLDRVGVWERPDGKVSVTHFHTDDMLPGETEDDFIDRMTVRIKSQSSHLKDIMPTLIARTQELEDKSNRFAWSLKTNKIEVDVVKVQAKLDQKKAKKFQRDEILAKLKISEEELDNLIKR